MANRPLLIFDFDVASPYTYLAAHMLPRFTSAFDVEVLWRPVLLGGVFKASGNQMPAANPHKATYMLRELTDLADLHRVPFRFPSHFPPNTLTAQRVLCAWDDAETLPQAARALFAAYWEHDRPISEPSEVALALAPLRSDAACLLERAATPEVKARLRANTDAAVKAGVFGLPAFHLGDRWWWGHDRLLLVARALKDIARLKHQDPS